MEGGGADAAGEGGGVGAGRPALKRRGSDDGAAGAVPAGKAARLGPGVSDGGPPAPLPRDRWLAWLGPVEGTAAAEAEAAAAGAAAAAAAVAAAERAPAPVLPPPRATPSDLLAALRAGIDGERERSRAFGTRLADVLLGRGT